MRWRPRRKPISSPLLEDASVNGARGVIINVTGGPDLSLMEVNEASCVIQEAAHEDANIIFGAVVDPKLAGKVKITVIATGFDRGSRARTVRSTAVQTPVDLQNYTAHVNRAAAVGSSDQPALERTAPMPEAAAALAQGEPPARTRADATAPWSPRTSRRRSTYPRSCAGRADTAFTRPARVPVVHYIDPRHARAPARKQ